MRPVVRFEAAAVDGYIRKPTARAPASPWDGSISPRWTPTSLPPHDGEPARRCDLERDSLVDAVASLKRETGKGIWLRGGAQLASTLFAAGLVDEIVRKLNPVLFGAGIPLEGRGIEAMRLHLLDAFVHPSGHVRVHYRVEH